VGGKGPHSGKNQNWFACMLETDRLMKRGEGVSRTERYAPRLKGAALWGGEVGVEEKGTQEVVSGGGVVVGGGIGVGEGWWKEGKCRVCADHPLPKRWACAWTRRTQCGIAIRLNLNHT